MEVSSKGITKQLPCNNQTIQAIRKYIQNYAETEMFRRLSDYDFFLRVFTSQSSSFTEFK